MVRLQITDDGEGQPITLPITPVEKHKLRNVVTLLASGAVGKKVKSSEAQNHDSSHCPLAFEHT